MISRFLQQFATPLVTSSFRLGPSCCRASTERTNRPLAAPELQVVAPDWQVVADAKWYGQVSPRAAAVYRHHGLVWRSAKALDQAKCIETPDGVRALIEAVYGDEAFDDIPPELQRVSRDAMGSEYAATSIANANLLDVREGYGGNNACWGTDTVTPFAPTGSPALNIFTTSPWSWEPAIIGAPAL